MDPEADALNPNNRLDGEDDVVSDENSRGGVDLAEEEEEEEEDVLRNVVKLRCQTSAQGGGICHVYLIGTAHVSKESCDEVEAVINFLKPEVVFLEICASRIAILTPQNLKIPSVGEMIDQWTQKKSNAFGILYSWFLAKVASKLEVLPGSEFRVAYEAAIKYGGKVILGDRPVNITIGRTWGKLSLWHKMKFVYALVFQAFLLPSAEDLNQLLKDLDDADMLTLVIQELSKEFPTMMETLVHERDKYMSSKLLKVASEHSSVVAVVGKGHLRGIKEHWQQPVELNELMSMPSKKQAVSVMKIIKAIGVTVAGAAIVSGFYISSRKQA